MAPAKNNQNDATRERLLDTAEKLFARKGFEAVSVREITSAAGCNLAAVNYHFGGKEKLYEAVLSERWRDRARRMLQPMEELSQQEEITPEQVVRTLATCFLKGPLTPEERLRHSQLIMREVSSPGEAFQKLAEGALNPSLLRGVALLERALPHKFSEERLQLICLSIFAQVIYFNFARPVVSSVTGHDYNSRFTDMLIEHITDFTLRGLRVEEQA